MLSPYTSLFRSPVQVGHLELRGDDVAGEAEPLAEVGVPRRDDRPAQGPVVLVVEELDDLLGYRPAAVTGPVGGDDEHVLLRRVEEGFGRAQRDALRREPEPLDEPVGVLRDGGEVDDLSHATPLVGAVPTAAGG